jgi:hypothetical protein
MRTTDLWRATCSVLVLILKARTAFGASRAVGLRTLVVYAVLSPPEEISRGWEPFDEFIGREWWSRKRDKS